VSTTGTSVGRAVDDLAPSTGWEIALGVALLAVGAFAILAPDVASIAGTTLVGWALLLAAIVQLVAAFREHGAWTRLGWLGMGLLSGVAAIWIFARPYESTVTLTIILAVWFIASGAVKAGIGVALLRARERGAAWVVAAGLVSAGFGVLVLVELPSSSLWAIGLLIGIDFVLAGAAQLADGLTRRHAGA
jgi:uncharacterized membrane protein HdeD (DUF308 family)